MNEQACPYETYSGMRAQAPAVEVRPGVYAITRYDDCRRVLMDWQTFSAVVGTQNMFALYGPSAVQDRIDAIMVDYPERPVLMQTDPPVHTQVRKLVERVLTVGAVRTIEPAIRQLVAEFASPWLRAGRTEFIGDFAVLLPNAVTAQLLGCPPDIRGQMKIWADEVLSRMDGPQTPERQIEVAAHIADMGRYFLTAIAARRTSPTSDLISLLAHAEVDGERLEDVAIVNVIETFMVGGHETTTYLLGNCLGHIANDPRLAETLRGDPEAIPLFVEEILRLEGPVQNIFRQARHDVEVGGVCIPAGATVQVTVASANRDGEIFDQPDGICPRRFADKSVRSHLAFGFGGHFCLGLNLARAELRIALETLLPQMEAIALEGDAPIDLIVNPLLRGPIRLNLRFRPISDAPASAAVG